MQIKHFGQGLGFVAHRYRVPNSACKFSVWFNRNGHAVDAVRIDRLNRSYPVTKDQWEYIQRHRVAGLFNESEIDKHRD